MSVFKIYLFNNGKFNLINPINVFIDVSTNNSIHFHFLSKSEGKVFKSVRTNNFLLHLLNFNISKLAIIVSNLSDNQYHHENIQKYSFFEL